MIKRTIYTLFAFAVGVVTMSIWPVLCAAWVWNDVDGWLDREDGQ